MKTLFLFLMLSFLSLASIQTFAAVSSCNFNGVNVPNGQKISAFNLRQAPGPLTCKSQFRTCTNGKLSGTNKYFTCKKDDYISGFKINITEKALTSKFTEAAVDLLHTKIEDALSRSKKFQQITKIQFWITDASWTRSAAVTHVSQPWLDQNNMNRNMYNGIEILNLENFIKWVNAYQPMMVLHEMAHAYQYNVLSWWNTDIEGVYRHAITQSLYDSVPYLTLNGQKKPAYAKENQWEYFAEMSEAYFGQNEFYPFIREQQKTYDTKAYDLMTRVWGK